jgi:hypothetical protein
MGFASAGGFWKFRFRVSMEDWENNGVDSASASEMVTAILVVRWWLASGKKCGKRGMLLGSLFGFRVIAGSS